MDEGGRLSRAGLLPFIALSDTGYFSSAIFRVTTWSPVTSW